MLKIVVTEFIDERVVDRLKERFNVVFDTRLVDDRQELLKAIEDADGVIVRNRTQVDSELLDGAPRLKVVGRLGVGLDNIDVDACESRGVAVKPAHGGNGSSVAEYVIAGALMLRRNAYFSSRVMLAGQWPRQELIGREISGSVLGLVGFGAIARETARRAQALDMQVVAYDPHLPEDAPEWGGVRRCETLDSLLEVADVVSLHVPLNDATRHLIDAGSLALMKSDAVLINAARGGVIDEQALATALVEHRLAGAMLDVFEQEPLARGSCLEGVPNLILTPHIAGVTAESNARISQITADNVTQALDNAEELSS
ncbi:hydroxyacid dehydrogenase [Halomonas urumqiensis]|uniref:3-phosphoglycerate dehydrogenase n=1 Tax=Halomonas urumqiensis TaxID=1684789 RepID=A0A2N7UQW6_9GAMM|nr:hydroxyacid dehydrogenase [Halomonas urumqiensis]PMR82824.1 3-phosphoglycerate dehydrogenase [Halomonas urumqiensis]PTB01857.1 3-phosphoglycerate dehydrogenase [Halomonas urumqiensis]GHE21961.1 2-hydroxyacid dehydrogenase [Halomonas urumqiensis]